MKTRSHKHALILTRQSSNQLVYGSLSLVNHILVAALVATRTANTWAGRISVPPGKPQGTCGLGV
jgi:hypothetical protein